MKAGMRAKWRTEDKGVDASQQLLLEDLQEIFEEVLSKVVEEAEGKKGGSYHVKRHKSRSKKKEVRTPLVCPQVLFYFCHLNQLDITCNK